jgi:hypothetical protein
VAVDGSWATGLFVNLYFDGRHVLAQCHTHPGRWVRHSRTDDQHALISTPGYVSIVIPDFASIDEQLGWGIWQVDANGQWGDGRDAVRWLGE